MSIIFYPLLPFSESTDEADSIFLNDYVILFFPISQWLKVGFKNNQISNHGQFGINFFWFIIFKQYIPLRENPKFK
jgi:hypothetical protein